MAPKSTSKPNAPAPPATKGDTVFLHEHLISVKADERVVPGPPTAAITAAINAGRRPTGDAYVERTERHEDTALVVWAVPTTDASVATPSPFGEVG